jgi:hypothetical protein
MREDEVSSPVASGLDRTIPGPSVRAVPLVQIRLRPVYVIDVAQSAHLTGCGPWAETALSAGLDT